MNSAYSLIRLNRLISSHRVKFFSVWCAHTAGLRHLFLRFDPVIACNLRCTMCYFSDDEYRKKNKGTFTAEEIRRLGELFFPRTLQLIIGCGTEPTLYRDFPDIVALAKRYRVPFVGLTTNGQLLTESHLRSLIANGLDEITLSVHGVRKETYERFMVNASFERFHETLRTLDALKKEAGSARPRLRMNYTVNAENLEELSGFFDEFGRYAIATLQVRPIMDIGGAYRTALGSDLHGRYTEIVGTLAGECRVRNVTFLANRESPDYGGENYYSVIVPAVRRYISPQLVWQSDFRWREESYRQYCRRIGWGKELLRDALSSRERVMSNNARKYPVRYEILT